ncbi:MAG: hypothetical protein ACXQS8_06390 [Candidatus Helarchaeales archaeon]
MNLRRRFRKDLLKLEKMKKFKKTVRKISDYMYRTKRWKEFYLLYKGSRYVVVRSYGFSYEEMVFEVRRWRKRNGLILDYPLVVVEKDGSFYTVTKTEQVVLTFLKLKELPGRGDFINRLENYGRIKNLEIYADF